MPSTWVRTNGRMEKVDVPIFPNIPWVDAGKMVAIVFDPNERIDEKIYDKLLNYGFLQDEKASKFLPNRTLSYDDNYCTDYDDPYHLGELHDMTTTRKFLESAKSQKVLLKITEKYSILSKYVRDLIPLFFTRNENIVYIYFHKEKERFAFTTPSRAVIYIQACCKRQ